MTTVYVNNTRTHSNGEQKYQTRIGEIESDEYIKISTKYDGHGASRADIDFNSLILLKFPCDVEDVLDEYREGVTNGTLRVWVLLKDDGAVIRQGDHLLISRALFQKQVDREDSKEGKLDVIMEHGVPYEDAIRLLKEAGGDVDEAIELWWAEEFGGDEFSDDDDSFIDKPGLLISLKNMGFDSERAADALVQSNYDILVALQLLTEPVEPEPVEPEPDLELETFFIERIAKVSDKDTSFVEVVSDGSITKCIYNVSVGELADWAIRMYDHQTNCAVFFVASSLDSSKIKHIGSTMMIKRDIFLGSRENAAMHGLFITEKEATEKKTLNENISESYDLAREACQQLYVEGQEYKCTWESQGPQYIMGKDEHSIREALEFKLKDISSRAVRARRSKVPESKIGIFVQHAIRYVTCILDASLIKARKTMPKKLRRQRSEGYTPPLKMQRQKSV